jgi:choline dehydrogenase-like flavoprotein
MSDDPRAAPRGRDGRAPDISRPGGWLPMRQFRDSEPVDFAIVGTGAGGATLACRLAEAGFSVVAFDAGAWWRPLEEFASDETEQSKLYWTDARLCDGDDPLKLGSNNSGKAVGGSTVHFAMVSLRFRPEWFKARSVLGYGADWPVSWQEMWRYYAEVEQALKIAGPVRYPWGPARPRYPYRPHEVNAAGLVLARGAEAMGIGWAPTPLATVSAPHGASPPCVYRGFCVTGCSTNAKQSALVVWVPRAVRAGAEIRDLAMVGRIETNADGRATGVQYHREGGWHFQAARNVVVAGYAIETPRLLLNSASPLHPDGLANSSGLVGRNLMVQSNNGVYATMPEEVRWYKGPPSLSLTEHWNYEDRGKDFHGGYAFMSQGPLPIAWAATQSSNRGLWGAALRDEMSAYNHQAGLKIVGEVLPDPANRVTLAEERDQYGLPIARVTFSYGDNDRRLIRHAVAQMTTCLEAAGGSRIWAEQEGTAHLHGTARMGASARDSVVDADCRCWDIRNLWVCDGSVFPTVGGVNPSLTIQALACRTADRIVALAAQGELGQPAGRPAPRRRGQVAAPPGRAQAAPSGRSGAA